MRKCVILLVVLSMLFSLLFGFSKPYSVKADQPNSDEIVKIARENLDQYLKENLKNTPLNDQAKQKMEKLKIPEELIDGVAIPKSLVETKHIKDGNAYIRVAIDGVSKTALSYAKDNNISINSTNLSPDDKAKVVNYIETIKAEHQIIKNQLAGLPVTVKNDLYVAYNGVIVETQIKNIKDLYARFGKDKVHIETIYTTDLNYSVPLIGAGEDGVWTDPDVDGTGMYVGVIDTGVDYTHPDLGGGSSFPTTKIPAGYDFGDDDEDPMDCNGHGTHVSGIMAADGVVADGGVKGVAPKAKIVFAKIVSGCKGSASDLTIAAAFDYMADPYNLDLGEEGTHPPVAAVNMSFGADDGFVTTDAPDQVAIENCIAAGIFVSLAAGNAYWSYQSYGYYPFFPDYATVGSPSVTPSAISVAASYNVIGKYPALTELSNSQLYAYTVGGDSQDPIATLGDNSGDGYKYYYCGLGGIAGDFPPEVSGNIALIQRGTYNFSLKIHNAADAGAIGAIIYNSAAGGDILLSMDTGGETLPAVFIGRTAGLALLAKAQNAGSDGTGRIAFYTDTFADSPLPADTMVDFSSWGPAPDLSFKPEITAPGGGIWSTVPLAQGSYANYSGTSMASPHVGAVGALVKEAHPTWSPAQIKIALMNTAKILTEPATGLPYSVLKMGAGRVDVYNALHNDVLLTDSSKGTPYVALGELPSYKTAPVVFTVRLTNTGSTDVNYDISSTIQTTYFNLTSMALTGATVTTIPSGSVTVPAGVTADVVVMIDATAVEDWTGFNYLEGFVKFTLSSGVELHIPYMGFLGKWNQFTDESAWDFNPLIDPAADDPMNFTQYLYGTGATWPELTDGSNWYYAGVDFSDNLNRNAIAFNPSADPTVQPNLLEADFWALRNMQNVTIEIRDQSNALVKTIDSTDYIYKEYLLPPDDTPTGWYSSGNTWWIWDGTDFSDNPVADGGYKLVIKATPPKIFNKMTFDDPQVIDFPIHVDTVSPAVCIDNITQNADGSYILHWSASDPAPSSEIWGYGLQIDSGNWTLVPPTSNSYKTGVLLSGSHTFTLVVYDNASNVGSDIADLNITLTSPDANPKYYYSPTLPLTVTVAGDVYSSSPISEFKIDGVDYTLGVSNTFTKDFTYTDYGHYTVQLYVRDNITCGHELTLNVDIYVVHNTIELTIIGRGTVTKSPDKSAYNYGEEVTLIAVPDTGWHFVSWGGDVTGTTNPLTVTMDGNKTITATFEINVVLFTLHIPSGWSLVSVPFDTDASLLACPLIYYFNGSAWLPETLTLHPGRGYLVLSTTPTLRDVILTGTPLSSPFSLSSPGSWQLIGNPFASPCTLSSTSPILLIYFFDATSSTWQPADTSNLQPGMGYLVLTSSPGMFIFTLKP